MKRVKAVINPGICGNHAVVTAVANEDDEVTISVESPCKTVNELVSNLPVIDAYTELGAGSSGVILSAGRQLMKSGCSGCVVPAGVFKAMQVSTNLALPKACTIELNVEEK